MKKTALLAKYLTLLLAFISLPALSATITTYCPAKDQITYTPIQTSWAAFKYTAQTTIDPPLTGKQLLFSGEGDSSKAESMTSAVWMDAALNCNYQGNKDPMVLTSAYLSNVKRCYFPNGKTFCDGADPADCPMTCELGQN